MVSTPAPRSASATRRPERMETSRSWDKPPARTTTGPTCGRAAALAWSAAEGALMPGPDRVQRRTGQPVETPDGFRVRPHPQ